MAPNSQTMEEPVQCDGTEGEKYKLKIYWRNVIQFALLHLGMLYGIYLTFTSGSWQTIAFAIILEQLAFLGITAGAHRLWSHRSYKAKWPLRAFLCILNCVAFQNDILAWSRDHRAHHKFTDTDADPHNIKRGFFFAHIGWLMCKKHPEVINKGRTICVDDILADPIVRFQRRFYGPLVIFFSFYLPTMIPVWCWGETLWNSFFVAAVARYGVSMNSTFLVNSAAHKFGYKPFDKKITSRENPLVSLLTTGEGWHNYHHVYPWDYSASELGYTINLTKVFIDIMAKIGQAYDLKTAKPNSIKNRKLKSGDDAKIILNEKMEENFKTPIIRSDIQKKINKKANE